VASLLVDIKFSKDCTYIMDAERLIQMYLNVYQYMYIFLITGKLGVNELMIIINVVKRKQIGCTQYYHYTIHGNTVLYEAYEHEDIMS
jgi:hypothetical protein